MSVNPEYIINYVHNAIKYMYKNDIRKEGENFFRTELNKYFKENKIWYIV